MSRRPSSRQWRWTVARGGLAGLGCHLQGVGRCRYAVANPCGGGGRLDDVGDARPATGVRVGLLVPGGIMAGLGSRLPVNSGINLVLALGLSEVFLSLTVIAMGTLLPELVTVVGASPSPAPPGAASPGHVRVHDTPARVRAGWTAGRMGSCSPPAPYTWKGGALRC
ncbi:MAG: hypothetical protein AB1576_01030 [Bacillota bacterium]